MVATRFFGTRENTDFTVAGFGGMRADGNGEIEITDVSGDVTEAILYWHGPTDSDDPTVNASVNFDGNDITGTQIGFSADNNWGFENSQSYRADVTEFVDGNGIYSLSDFIVGDVSLRLGEPAAAEADINGVSLLVFFDDGDSSNDRTVLLFEGNDSNQDNFFDTLGWDIDLGTLDFEGGDVNLTLGVSDGQIVIDGPLTLNGQIIADGDWANGGTVPTGDGGASNGGLWDLNRFEIENLLTVGENELDLDLGITSDFLSLVHASLDVPATASIDAPAPIAEDDVAETDEGTPVAVDILANDVVGDTPLDLSSLTIVAEPANGSIEIDPDTGLITYTPNGNFSGDDGFAYTIADEDGDVSNEASVAVTVNDTVVPPVPMVPTANDDVAETETETPIDIAILNNDVLADTALDPASVEIVDGPSDGIVEIDPETGLVTYTPADGFSGDDGFSYTVADTDGDRSEAASVSITITDGPEPPDPENQAPSASDDSVVIGDDGSVIIDLLANDSDPDGELDVASIAIIDGPKSGTAEIQGDGTVLYTAVDEDGSVACFSYTVTDDDGAVSNSAVVTISLNASAPIVPVDFPVIGEGIAVEEINGLDPALVMGDGATEFAVVLESETSVSRDSLGTYTVNDQGEIVDARFLFANTDIEPETSSLDERANAGDRVSLGQLEAGQKIGFFLANNAFNLNDAEIFETGRIEFRNPETDEISKVTDTTGTRNPDGDPQLVHIGDDGTETVVEGVVFHTADASPQTPEHNRINPDDEGHVVSGTTEEGDVLVGFEDGLGERNDNDHNDLIIRIERDGEICDPSASHLAEAPSLMIDDVLSTDADDQFMGAMVETVAGDEMASSDASASFGAPALAVEAIIHADII
ncbi:MAG: Ig-like domain-containing protein [Geminicoccaceae bacterium]